MLSCAVVRLQQDVTLASRASSMHAVPKKTIAKRVPHCSAEKYQQLVNALARTNTRLEVDCKSYIKMQSVRKQQRVPTRCVQCNAHGSIRIGNVLSQGASQPCFCNGKLKYSDAPDQWHARLDSLVEQSRFEWHNLVSRFDSIANIKSSRIKLRCVECDSVVEPEVGAFVTSCTAPTSNCDWSRRQIGCACPPLPQASSYAMQQNKERVESAVLNSRFVFQNPSSWHQDVTNQKSRIDLECKVCNTVVTPRIGKLMAGRVGCLCDNSTEKKVVTFAREVLASLFPDRALTIQHKLRAPGLVGVGGGNLEFDAVLAEQLDDGEELLLFIEVDGGHHFGGGHALIPGKPNHTLEHDERKEEYVWRRPAAMVRLEQRTVEYDHANWAMWFQAKLEAAINRKLLPGIYRLSCGSHYVTGEYAQRRLAG